MQTKLFKDEYPIYTMTLKKEETSMPSISALITHFQSKIQEHPFAIYIGIFDHYRHTTSIQDGVIDAKMLDAQNILCCFGKNLENAEVLAVRPRSIGIAEYQDKYIISFLKAPNPAATDDMVAWTQALKDL